MTRYPEVYNSYQYAMLSNEAANNIGLADVYNEEKMEKFRTGDGEFYKSTNWLHAITRDNAPETSHNFSVKGGNEYARYYLSAGVMDQQSYFRSNDWNNRRYSMHAHIGTTLAKGLDVDVLLTAQSDRRNVSGGSGVFKVYSRQSHSEALIILMNRLDRYVLPSKNMGRAFLMRDT